MIWEITTVQTVKPWHSTSKIHVGQSYINFWVFEGILNEEFP